MDASWNAGYDQGYQAALDELVNPANRGGPESAALSMVLNHLREHFREGMDGEEITALLARAETLLLDIELKSEEGLFYSLYADLKTLYEEISREGSSLLVVMHEWEHRVYVLLQKYRKEDQ